MNSAAGKRILILEDDVLLAIDVAETIQEMGAEVIGPAHRVESAMDLLDAQRPDAALLDVNIIGSTSAQVANRLVREGIPFVLATGYGVQNDIPGSRAVVDKPYRYMPLSRHCLAKRRHPDTD
jgi:DNA-binding NarL/FixJ family response regulator